MSPAIRCDRVVHVYGRTGQEVTALRSIDLEVERGETVALLGPSGSGKSTLLWLLAALIRPTAGRVEVAGRLTGELKPGEAATFRRRQVGVVLQNPARNLIPYETALGNVSFAQRTDLRRAGGRRRHSQALLESVGLGHVAQARAGGLSGGEQQRLALAVALANGPEILLADEPTSQLDHETAAAVVALIKAANAEHGTTVVAVTHDPAVGAALGRTVTIRDGRIGSEGRSGDEYLVVGPDGSIQLPDHLLETFPPGSLLQAHPSVEGVELRPYRPERAP